MDNQLAINCTPSPISKPVLLSGKDTAAALALLKITEDSRENPLMIKKQPFCAVSLDLSSAL